MPLFWPLLSVISALDHSIKEAIFSLDNFYRSLNGNRRRKREWTSGTIPQVFCNKPKSISLASGSASFQNQRGKNIKFLISFIYFVV